MALVLGLERIPVTVGAGTSLSAAVPTGTKTVCGMAIPAIWSAAALTFQVSVDGGSTWLDLYDVTGSEVSVTAAAGQYHAIDPVVFAAINHVKVRSGTSGAPVVQTADRTITLVVRGV